MRRLLTILILSVVVTRSSGLGVRTNYDYATINELAGFYGLQVMEEEKNLAILNDILEHYKRSELATAGIFASKWFDRKAMSNPGLFGDSRENYYYRRIYSLVSEGILRKVVTCGGLMIKHPERGLYWGPYLFQVLTETKQLCMIFQEVATDGKLSFDDINWVKLDPRLEQLFNLVQLGDVDWELLWDRLTDFPGTITKEKFLEDIATLAGGASGIANAGGAVLDSVWVNASSIGKIISGKPRDFLTVYNRFDELYHKVSSMEKVRKTVLDYIESTDSVARLFDADTYNISGYVSDYIHQLVGQYYTQRWYITPKYSSYEELYSEVYDSKYSTEEIMLQRMNEQVSFFRQEDESNGIYRAYTIHKDQKQFYQEADASALNGVCACTFTVHCEDYTEIAKGSTRWWENDSHDHDDVREDSRRYAMRTTSVENPDLHNLEDQIQYNRDRVLDLQGQIDNLDARNRDILTLLSDTLRSSQRASLTEEYNSNNRKIAGFRIDIEMANDNINNYNSYYNQIVEEQVDDEVTRLPQIMHQLQVTFPLHWLDAGHWEGDTFVRQCSIDGIGADVTFRADLTCERGETHIWIVGRIHRAILAVSWTLVADYGSSNIVDVMELNPSDDASVRADIINSRAADIRQDYPGCRVETTMAYSEPASVEDKGGYHLLWFSDRLRIAMEVMNRLENIHSRLTLCETYLRRELSLRQFAFNVLGLTALDRNTRVSMYEENLSRWRGAASSTHSGYGTVLNP